MGSDWWSNLLGKAELDFENQALATLLAVEKFK